MNGRKGFLLPSTGAPVCEVLLIFNIITHIGCKGNDYFYISCLFFIKEVKRKAPNRPDRLTALSPNISRFTRLLPPNSRRERTYLGSMLSALLLRARFSQPASQENLHRNLFMKSMDMIYFLYIIYRWKNW
jgi:hypothetical protein